MTGTVLVHNRFADQLRPRRVGLVLVDCQETLLSRLDDEAAPMRNNLIGLARLAKVARLPVLLASRSGAALGPIMAELVDLLVGAPLVRRTNRSFWDDGASRAAVRALRRRELIFAGIMPNAVASTAIAARFAGYGVEIAVDATVGFDNCAPHVEKSRMGAVGVHLTSWIALMAELTSAGVEIGPAEAAALRDNLSRYTVSAAYRASEELSRLADNVNPVPRWN
jgi:nicotinamidase-related amidase